MDVLICDDDPPTRLIIRRLLESYFRCTVSECANGVEALGLIAGGNFAFMFLDLVMPVMDGLETLERIRGTPETADLPVVILSSENDQQAIVNVLRLGITDYIVKPPHTHTVLAKVQKIVSSLPPM